MLKNSLTVSKYAAFALVSTALTACHHDNPLRIHSKKESAEFLMNASANAEKRLHLNVKESERGYGYMECMQGEKTPEIPCPLLKKEIIKFAQENHYPAFSSLTLADINELETYKVLEGDYIDILVATFPRYY